MVTKKKNKEYILSNILGNFSVGSGFATIGFSKTNFLIINSNMDKAATEGATNGARLVYLTIAKGSQDFVYSSLLNTSSIKRHARTQGVSTNTDIQIHTEACKKTLPLRNFKNLNIEKV